MNIVYNSWIIGVNRISHVISKSEHIKLGYLVVQDDTEVGRLLDASGVGERWHKEPKKQIYLMCKLDCPWGHSVYGAANIKCNCKHGGWNKNPGYCLAEKMPSAPSSGEKLSLDDIANS